MVADYESIEITAGSSNGIISVEILTENDILRMQ